jgi:hypothetical protein
MLATIVIFAVQPGRLIQHRQQVVDDAGAVAANVPPGQHSPHHKQTRRG